MYDKTTFLNVDLELSSREDLASLAAALQPRLTELHVGRVGRTHWARLELRRHPRTPDAAIRQLVSAIQSLPGRQRARWNRATRRDFNIGIQAAEEPRYVELPLAPTTVKMVGQVGARIVVTVYGLALARA